MSQLLNGNSFHRHTYAFPLADISQVGEVRRFALLLAESLNFEDTRHGRIGIVINELANNLVKYAREGEILLRRITSPGDRAGIEILSIDKGPGLNFDVVMQDGFSTGSTPGTGLGAVRRLSDTFDIYSSIGRGTSILSRIYESDRAAGERGHRFEIGAISVPLGEESVCGDAWCVREYHGELNAIIVDGLGHGSQAYRAASEAIDVFERCGEASSIEQTMNLIHGRLKSTRGGAIFLLHSKKDAIEFAGVGNIAASLRSEDRSKSLLSHNGTAGIQIRTVRRLTENWAADEQIVCHSDGILSRWDLNDYPGLQKHHPSLVASVIYRDFRRGTDDTTLLVVKRRTA